MSLSVYLTEYVIQDTIEKTNLQHCPNAHQLQQILLACDRSERNLKMYHRAVNN